MSSKVSPKGDLFFHLNQPPKNPTIGQIHQQLEQFENEVEKLKNLSSDMQVKTRQRLTSWTNFLENKKKRSKSQSSLNSIDKTLQRIDTLRQKILPNPSSSPLPKNSVTSSQPSPKLSNYTSLTEHDRVLKKQNELNQLQQDIKNITEESAEYLCRSFQLQKAYFQLLGQHDILSHDKISDIQKILTSIETDLKKHPFSKQHLKTVIPHGIHNGGNHCCFISALQILQWSLGKKIFELLPNFLSSLFTNYATLSEGKAIREHLNKFCKSAFSTCGQEDASEILSQIFSRADQDDIEEIIETPIEIKRQTTSFSAQPEAEALFLKLENMSQKIQGDSLAKDQPHSEEVSLTPELDAIGQKEEFFTHEIRFDKSHSTYILPQTSLEKLPSLDHFWQLAAKDENQVIIDLTSKEDLHKPYYPTQQDNSLKLKNATLKLLSCADINDATSIYQYEYKNQNNDTQTIMRLHFHHWDKACALPSSEMAHLINAINIYSRGKTPIIHSLEDDEKADTLIACLELEKQKEHIASLDSDEFITSLIRQARALKGKNFIKTKGQLQNILDYSKFLKAGMKENDTPRIFGEKNDRSCSSKFSLKTIKKMISESIISLIMHLFVWIDRYIVRIDKLHTQTSKLKNIGPKKKEPEKPQASWKNPPQEREKHRIKIEKKNENRPNKATITKQLASQFGELFSILKFDTTNLPKKLQDLDEFGGTEHISSRREPMVPLSIGLNELTEEDDSYDFQTLLRSFAEEETVDPKTITYQEQKYSANQRKTTLIATPPEQLILNFKRFMFSKRQNKAIKITNAVENIPETFTLPQDIFAQGSDTKYELNGLIKHIGSSAVSGHYIAYIKIEDMWFCCNDDNITPVPVEDVLKAAKTSYVLIANKVKND